MCLRKLVFEFAYTVMKDNVCIIVLKIKFLFIYILHTLKPEMGRKFDFEHINKLIN